MNSYDALKFLISNEINKLRPISKDPAVTEYFNSLIEAERRIEAARALLQETTQ